MSNRTAESNRAIALAWENEQKCVSEGKGTRDWSPKQQKDILERGKAYDDEGRAFQGHHMRSVSISPEEQGNPDNIQFLSHEEHIEAHIICWQPTNWYYDPVTKQRVDFGEGPIVPCKVIELSAPVAKIEIEGKSQQKNEVKPGQTEGKKSNGTDSPSVSIEPKVKTVSQPTAPALDAKKSKGVGAFFRKIGNGIIKGAKVTGKFIIEHKEEIGLVASFLVVADSNRNRSSQNNSSSSYPVSDNTDYDRNLESFDGFGTDESEADDRDYPETHASPKEHIVPGHGQHYHTKDGEIWKEKAPYKRGGSHSDDE